jgi:hypothetical protein
MKTIQLTSREFVTFKTLANRMQLMFMYWISGGTIFIKANTESLSRLGY